MSCHVMLWAVCVCWLPIFPLVLVSRLPSSFMCVSPGSLVRGGVRGVFSSASGFTGFLNRSLAQLSFDDRIISRQAKESRQKPKHAVHGLGMGLSEISKGVVKGVTGA
jgi:hypothetical protein